MAFKKAKSSNWWRTQGGATELTLTQAGAGTGSAVLQGNQIIFDVAAVAVNDPAMTISTPISFRVVDVRAISTAGTAAVLDIDNGSSSVLGGATLTMAGDTDVIRATEIDDAYWEFAAGDDDLKVHVATAVFAGMIIIDILPT
jgi:hypothetical protein|tara:strand:+ start:52 stop:480 length:429 start_codon:yes stop_codon:yes gene_type:complete